MIANTIVCDLCPASAPKENYLGHGFTTLNLQGEGPSKLRSLLGAACPSHIDLCPECFAGLLGWAHAHRAARQSQAATEPAPVAVEPPNEQPVTDSTTLPEESA
jgi:hypothetical protein